MSYVFCRENDDVRLGFLLSTQKQRKLKSFVANKILLITLCIRSLSHLIVNIHLIVSSNRIIK